MTSTVSRLSFRVNGSAVSVDLDGLAMLADVLRQDLGLTGTHLGCRSGDCGACTVIVDGHAFKSCLVPAHRVEGCDVETIEGLAKDSILTDLQEQFWSENAFQCGYCLAGHLLCLTELKRSNPDATEQNIILALSGNLCRCTGYQQILQAALSAFRQNQNVENGS